MTNSNKDLSSQCMLYTSIPHFENKREATECATYRRGLFTVVRSDSWHCEGLEHERTRVRIPRLFYIFLSTID